MIASIPIGDDDLHAYVDRRLLPGRMAEVEAYLGSHPDQAERLGSYAGQGAILAAALRTKLEEPIPCRLRVAVILARQRQRRAGQAARAAAVLLVAFTSGAAGWLGHAWTGDRSGFQAAAQSAFAAYQTFSVEVRHPVEVRAEDGAHLQQWLSNRLQRPLTPPNLASLGYQLIGGRVLPAASGPAVATPAAQLMYDTGNGGRLTVYAQPLGVDAEEFHYVKQGDVRTVVWAERRMVIAVTGRVPQATLVEAARLVSNGLERRQAIP